MDRVNGGTFDLQHSRGMPLLSREIEELLNKHDLDFLCVQNARQYWQTLHSIPEYQYFATTKYLSGIENGILVRNGFGDKPSHGRLGDSRLRGASKRHNIPTFPRITVCGWLRIGVVRMPKTVESVDRRLVAFSERHDEYLVMSRRVLRFLMQPGKAKLVLGGWSEPPNVKDRWSPGWVAQRARAQIAAPVDPSGSGCYDYPIWKRCRVSDIRKDLDTSDYSDHEPVLFTVYK